MYFILHAHVLLNLSQQHFLISISDNANRNYLQNTCNGFGHLHTSEYVFSVSYLIILITCFPILDNNCSVCVKNKLPLNSASTELDFDNIVYKCKQSNTILLYCAIKT